jgi:hypothetical protein
VVVVVVPGEGPSVLTCHGLRYYSDGGEMIPDAMLHIGDCSAHVDWC